MPKKGQQKVPIFGTGKEDVPGGWEGGFRDWSVSLGLLHWHSAPVQAVLLGLALISSVFSRTAHPTKMDLLKV